LTNLALPTARVLIVDDLAENRVMLGLCCDRFGLLHEAVDSGREAVEAARSGRFDAILMDIFMPGMDGMAATHSIRALSGRPASVPIIAVTTAADPGIILRYLACGMTDVVAKPINASRLAEALSAVLSPARRNERPKRRGAASSSRERAA
jgi:CheY-like chemotaxis protein